SSPPWFAPPASQRSRCCEIFPPCTSLCVLRRHGDWKPGMGHIGAADQHFGGAAGTALAALFSLRFRLGDAANVNVTPSGHWPQPIVVEDIAADCGPVLITIEYRIALDLREEFLTGNLQ